MSLRFVRVGNVTGRRSLAAMALLGVIALTGCGGSGHASPTPAPGPTRTPVVDASPSATPAPAIFGQIVWASAVDPGTSAPIGKVSSFAPDAPTIYAAAPVMNVAAGLVVSADWSFNGAALSGVTSTVAAPKAVANGWIEFHLTLAAGQTWPVGTYGVVVRQPHGNSVHSGTKVKRPAS